MLVVELEQVALLVLVAEAEAELVLDSDREPMANVQVGGLVLVQEAVQDQVQDQVQVAVATLAVDVADVNTLIESVDVLATMNTLKSKEDIPQEVVA